MAENRIVSLLASATEIVCALGQEEQLIGISHECDFPSTVMDRDRCTETKFMVDGLGCEIDERIKSIVRDGLSVYRVFPEKLDALKPDVVIVPPLVRMTLLPSPPPPPLPPTLNVPAAPPAPAPVRVQPPSPPPPPILRAEIP